MSTTHTINSRPILSLLAGLVDKSLVVYEEQPDGTARYRLLETTRQYAREILTSSEEANTVRKRQCDYYLQWVESICPPRTMSSNWSRMAVEHDNLREAMDFCRESEDGAEPGLRLVNSMLDYLFNSGFEQEVRQRLAEALAHSHIAPTPAWWDARLTQASFLPNSPAKQSAIEECLAAYRETQDRVGEAVALWRLGLFHSFHSIEGNREEARHCYQEALDLLRERDEQSWLPVLLFNLGTLAYDDKDYEVALLLFEEAHARELARGHQEGWARVWIGDAAYQVGDYARAKARYREGIRIYAAANSVCFANSLFGLVRLAAVQRQWERATHLLGAADRYIEKSIGVSLDMNVNDVGLKRPADAPISAILNLNVEGIGPLVEILKAELGETAFISACAAGRTMTQGEAIEYALQEVGSAL